MTTPVLCELCHEYFPTEQEIWSHECPGVERLLRRKMPTLGCYGTVIRFHDEQPDGFWKRVIAWGVRRSGGEDADLLDALRRLDVRYVHRVEQNLVRRGLAEPPESKVADEERLRRELDAEYWRELVQ